MNIKKLNEHIESFCPSDVIIRKSNNIPSVCMDDSCLSETIWFGDVGRKYEMAISRDEYFKKINIMINRLIKRKKIDLRPKKSESLCSDGHYFVTGDIGWGNSVAAVFEYTGTIRDVVTNAHLMGHLMGKIVIPSKVRNRMTYDNAMIMKNVLPILIEKIVLEDYGHEELNKYYKNLRKYRFRKMCDVDIALRNIDGPITERSIQEMLDFNINITYRDVEDYCAEVERGNDPVYKSYCYFVADDLASRMFARKNFKKDTRVLTQCDTVAELSDYLTNPTLKK